MARRQHSRDGRGIDRKTRCEPVAAVTFDVTHTLIYSPRMAEIYGEVLRRHGLRVSTRELSRKIPLVWKEFGCLADPRRDRFSDHARGARGWWHRFLVRLCEHLDVAPASRFAAAELFDRFARAGAWELYEDVISTLGALREAGVRLGVISNWDHRLPVLLERLGLMAYFDAVVYSSAAGLEKPHPQIFRSCLTALEVPAALAVHVGDSAIEDVEGALAAGMRAVHVDRATPRCHLLKLLTPLLTPAAPCGGGPDRWGTFGGI